MGSETTFLNVAVSILRKDLEEHGRLKTFSHRGQCQVSQIVFCSGENQSRVFASKREKLAPTP